MPVPPGGLAGSCLASGPWIGLEHAPMAATVSSYCSTALLVRTMRQVRVGVHASMVRRWPPVQAEIGLAQLPEIGLQRKGCGDRCAPPREGKFLREHAIRILRCRQLQLQAGR